MYVYMELGRCQNIWMHHLSHAVRDRKVRQFFLAILHAMATHARIMRHQV